MAISTQSKETNTYRQFRDDSKEKLDDRTADASWFVGNIPKRETEILAAKLPLLPPGAFFVRVMKSLPGCYGLVILDHGNKVRNLIIEQLDAGFRLRAGPMPTQWIMASSVYDLVKLLARSSQRVLAYSLRPDIHVQSIDVSKQTMRIPKPTPKSPQRSPTKRAPVTSASRPTQAQREALLDHQMTIQRNMAKGIITSDDEDGGSPSLRRESSFKQQRGRPLQRSDDDYGEAEPQNRRTSGVYDNRYYNSKDIFSDSEYEDDMFSPQATRGMMRSPSPQLQQPQSPQLQQLQQQPSMQQQQQLQKLLQQQSSSNPRQQQPAPDVPRRMSIDQRAALDGQYTVFARPNAPIPPLHTGKVPTQPGDYYEELDDHQRRAAMRGSEYEIPYAPPTPNRPDGRGNARNSTSGFNVGFGSPSAPSYFNDVDDPTYVEPEVHGLPRKNDTKLGYLSVDPAERKPSGRRPKRSVSPSSMASGTPSGVTNSESSGVAVRYNDGDGYDSDSMLDDNAEVIIPNRSQSSRQAGVRSPQPTELSAKEEKQRKKEEKQREKEEKKQEKERQKRKELVEKEIRKLEKEEKKAEKELQKSMRKAPQQRVSETKFGFSDEDFDDVDDSAGVERVHAFKPEARPVKSALKKSSTSSIAETSGMPKKKGVSFSNLNAGSNSNSENSSGRNSPSKRESTRKPRKHASFSVRDVEDDSASDQDIPSPKGKGKDKKRPSFPDDDEYEPDFYEEKQPQSLLESLGMAQDDQRMNVVLSSKIDANDKAAAHELSKMYISPVPRTGILNK